MLINKENLLRQLDDRPPDGWISVQAVRAMIDAEEEKTGRWVEIERDDVNPFTGRRGVYVGCSECGSPIPTDSQIDFMDEGESKYCYNCGAMMEE